MSVVVWVVTQFLIGLLIGIAIECKFIYKGSRNTMHRVFIILPYIALAFLAWEWAITNGTGIGSPFWIAVFAVALNIIFDFAYLVSRRKKALR